jgi:hypothetical protein
MMRGLPTFLSLVLLALAAHAQVAHAQTAHAQAAADCAHPPAQPVMQVALPGHPFSAIPSRDGCSIFVSLTGQTSHLLVVSRSGGAVTIAHDITAKGGLTGMRLSPDGKLLAAQLGRYHPVRHRQAGRRRCPSRDRLSQ